MKKTNLLKRCLFLFAFVWASLSSIHAQEKIYWADGADNAIKRSNLDGSSVETLVTGLGFPTAIALDEGNGKMYWTDQNNRTITRANLDGTAVEILVSNVNVKGIALDLTNGKMYWTQGGPGGIQRANLDGSMRELIIDTSSRANGPFTNAPYGIALDEGNGKIYWTESLGSDRFVRANFDGSMEEILLDNTELDNPLCFALDCNNGKAYIANSHKSNILKVNLDGTGVEVFISGLNGPAGIGIDFNNNKIYWNDDFGQVIQRASLDGSMLENIGTGIRPLCLALTGQPILTCDREVTISINDPCSCADDMNRKDGAGTITHFHDVLTVDVAGSTGQSVVLTTGGANFLDANLNPIADGTTLGMIPLNYDFFHASGASGSITLTVGGVEQAPFAISVCSEDACAAPIPTMSEWGLLIFCLLVLNMGVFAVRQRALIIK